MARATRKIATLRRKYCARLQHRGLVGRLIGQAQRGQHLGDRERQEHGTDDETEQERALEDQRLDDVDQIERLGEHLLAQEFQKLGPPGENAQSSTSVVPSVKSSSRIKKNGQIPSQRGRSTKSS